MNHRNPTRRDFLTLGVGAFVLASAPWALRRREPLVRRTLPVMGTLAEVAIVHRDERYAQRAIDAALAELQQVERTMSRFRADSEVGRANRYAAAGPVVVSAATGLVLAEALHWAAATDGRFDPCLARAVELWDVTARSEPPAPAALQRLAGLRLHRALEIGRRGAEHTVIFHDPAVALDLGGIAKGYAVDRAVAVLRDWGVRHALVNAGGDLYALGRAPDGEPWRVGVQSPFDAGRLVATLDVEDRAVATSGDYRQYFEHAGRRYHHLLDPATAAPRRTAQHTLTAAADRCMAADAAATAAFGCAPDEAARLVAAAARGAEIAHHA